MGFKVVITGGSGSGKSTLCRAFQQLGYPIFQEVARELIEAGHLAPIHAREQSVTDHFADTILEMRIRNYREAEHFPFSFFDRGLPDSLAFSLALNKKPDLRQLQAAKDFRYHQVFILPPWEEIFVSDGIRKEDFEWSTLLYNSCLKVYKQLNYNLIEVPIGTVKNRIKFILDQMILAPSYPEKS